MLWWNGAMAKKTKKSKVPKEFRSAAVRFREHEGVSPRSVQKWVQQWENADSELAKKVLRETRFYSASDIRGMLQQLVARVYQHTPGIPNRQVVFVPAGRPFSGAAVLGRALRDTKGVHKSQIRSLPELLASPDGEVKVVVLVEDFSGTGRTIESWWYTVEPLVLPKVPTVIFGLLVLNFAARPKLEQFTAQVIRVQELTIADNVLSEECAIFEPGEKGLLLEYCTRTQSSEEYRRGFGNCGLLIAFKHFCPNNALPILWHKSPQWRNLFKRTAI
jgi:hypothetical protein